AARIGRSFLKAGLGFGGGCLPKDIRAFAARAAELDASAAVGFLREVDAINTRRRERAADLVREACGGSVSGRRIAVLGATFKPNSDDIRDSPGLYVAAGLPREGAIVVVTDPHGLDNARRAFGQLGYEGAVTGAVRDADVVLLATEWPEYAGLDPPALAGLVAERTIVDARNVLDADHWRSAGWTYRALGR